MNLCTDNGEHADFWLTPEPGMNDLQMGGLVLCSLMRGLSAAMKGQRRGGASCDIHPQSLLALIGEAKGVAIGPVVYAPNLCRASSPPASSRHEADRTLHDSCDPHSGALG